MSVSVSVSGTGTGTGTGTGASVKAHRDRCMPKRTRATLIDVGKHTARERREYHIEHCQSGSAAGRSLSIRRRCPECKPDTSLISTVRSHA